MVNNLIFTWQNREYRRDKYGERDNSLLMRMLPEESPGFTAWFLMSLTELYWRERRASSLRAESWNPHGQAPYFGLQESVEDSAFANLSMCCHHLGNFLCSLVPYRVFLQSTFSWYGHLGGCNVKQNRLLTLWSKKKRLVFSQTNKLILFVELHNPQTQLRNWKENVYQTMQVVQ